MRKLEIQRPRVKVDTVISRARPPFELGSHRIAPGTRLTIDLPVSVLSDHTPVTMSVHAVHGREKGPVLFVSAAIHGDEIIGVEIVRRLLRAPSLRNLRGTLLTAPVVNAFGYMNHSRYLPDRRDLNRSFPGSPSGSLASRLANLFYKEIVCRSEVGIDIHSAAIHRTNLPQIRISPGRKNALKHAHRFGAPLVLISKLRENSLRKVAEERNIDVLVYEAGEGLRLVEKAIRTGLSGILRVMQMLGMLPPKSAAAQGVASPLPICSLSSAWVRAPVGGLLRTYKTIGQQVAKDGVLGVISDPFGEAEASVLADQSGLIIGRTNLPTVNEGDGLFHIAALTAELQYEHAIDGGAEQHAINQLPDEDEII